MLTLENGKADQMLIHSPWLGWLGCKNNVKGSPLNQMEKFFIFLYRSINVQVHLHLVIFSLFRTPKISSLLNFRSKSTITKTFFSYLVTDKSWIFKNSLRNVSTQVSDVTNNYKYKRHFQDKKLLTRTNLPNIHD